jgi:hypothetical protein
VWGGEGLRERERETNKDRNEVEYREKEQTRSQVWACSRWSIPSFLFNSRSQVEVWACSRWSIPSFQFNSSTRAWGMLCSASYSVAGASLAVSAANSGVNRPCDDSAAMNFFVSRSMSLSSLSASRWSELLGSLATWHALKTPVTDSKHALMFSIVLDEVCFSSPHIPEKGW